MQQQSTRRKTGPAPIPALDRFLTKIVPLPDGCWGWKGSRHNAGYSSLGVNRRPYLAHRFSYEWFVGAIPKCLELDHLCRNRWCVNPDHLEAVTRRENMLRGDTIAAANFSKVGCPYGHGPYDIRTKKGDRWCQECHRLAEQKRRDRMNPAHLGKQTDRTHCPRGHEYTPANTYINPHKTVRSRICRTCHRIKQRAYKAARRTR
jgi:hypothetical protein